MKSVFLAAAGLALAGFVMSGCAAAKKDMSHLSGIRASDYVTPADYGAIEVEAASPEVSDEYLDMYVQYQMSMQASNEEVTDRDTVESGDTVNIDYVGKKDGVAFDGGTASGYNLTIGSNTFIAGFEDGLIGAKKGETVLLNLTFPENYSSEELAGQDVTFDVTINSISRYVTPELTDETAASMGIEGVTTAQEYREYLRNQLMEQAQASHDSEVRQQIVSYLVDNSTFAKDPPPELVERFNQSFTEMFSAYAQQYGMELGAFMNLQGYGEDTYAEDIRDMAADTAKEYIVLQAIADKEKLNVSDKEFEEKMAEEAANAGYASVTEFKKEQDTEEFREYLMVQNVLGYLQENANITQPQAED